MLVFSHYLPQESTLLDSRVYQIKKMFVFKYCLLHVNNIQFTKYQLALNLSSEIIHKKNLTINQLHHFVYETLYGSESLSLVTSRKYT